MKRSFWHVAMVTWLSLLMAGEPVWARGFGGGGFRGGGGGGGFHGGGGGAAFGGGGGFRGSNLVMQPDSGGTLIADIVLKDDGALTFAAIGDAQKLTFTR